MGKFKEALKTNTEKFSNKYGYIFTSLYLYEYQQQYQNNTKLENMRYPEIFNDISQDIIKHTLSNYFDDLLKSSGINIDLICPKMLFYFLELYDY
jgi:hypothetical protein